MPGSGSQQVLANAAPASDQPLMVLRTLAASALAAEGLAMISVFLQQPVADCRALGVAGGEQHFESLT